MMIDKTCAVCKKVFKAKQDNYHCCSKECGHSYQIVKMRNRYLGNREAAIAINSARLKRNPVKQACIICKTDFLNRAGTKCCSDVCREELNLQECNAQYRPTHYNNICKICNNIFNSSTKSNHCSDSCYQAHKTIYMRYRNRTNLNAKLAANLRSRLSTAIHDNQKTGSAIDDLGCSINKLKIKLQLGFYRHPANGEYMSWDNYGKFGWHIDHIVALANFDLSNREQFLKACHYTNLQPLWARENHKKGPK